MKKNYFYTYKSTIAAIALSLLFCGCAKEVEQLQPQEELHEVVFHAGWAPETKTVLQEDGSVWWSPGDEIALCLTGHEDKYCLKSDCKEPSQETNFIGMIGKNDGEDTFYAIYPYDKVKGTNPFSITIPSVQYATAGAISPGQFCGCGRADGNGTDIGIYEGATYSFGCWKPSQHSIMNNDADGMFNAPSREAIYKRIHRLAFGKDWQYDYEKFVEYDQKNIAAEKATAASVINRSPSIDSKQKSFVKFEKSMTSDGKEKITIIMN